MGFESRDERGPGAARLTGLEVPSEKVTLLTPVSKGEIPYADRQAFTLDTRRAKMLQFKLWHTAGGGRVEGANNPGV
jgi:hypothetical protein